MSGGSSANNSWTILTSEETVAETLRPLAEGTEQNEESQTSAAGSGETSQPANAAEPAEGLPVQDKTESEDKPAEISEASVPTTVTETPIPSTLEASGSSVHGGDEVGQTEISPEGPTELSPDPDSSSDSYTCISASPDDPPASLLSTETVGSAELAPDEEKEAQYHLNGEELHLEGEESEHLRSSDLGKQADSPLDSEAAEERTGKTGEEGEPEVRRRRSLLAALERVGRREEEEEDEEFQMPQREEDSGFSVNKCILGAVILLGLGTIFFSESDYGPTELKGAEVPGKQEWLNPEAPPPPVDADSSQLLNKLAEGSQQISVLQAQLQAQKEELKVAEGHAAEGVKERRRWEEVEKENTADHVKPATSPPTGQSEDSRQAGKPWDDHKEKKKKDLKRDKHDMGAKKEWKEKPVDNKERKDAGKKEWKKEKHEQVMFEKEGKHKKQSDETKQWKKEKTSRGDEGKPWKNWEGKKEWIGKGEKEWKEEKERKKVKHEKVNEGKPWKGGKEEWKGEKEWKKVKDGFKESGKEKWERKEWKERGEKKEWKERGEKKDRKEKGEKKDLKEKEKKDWKEKGERKEWKERGEKKEWKERGEKKEWKDRGERKDWKETEKKDWKEKGEKKEWKEKGEKKEWKEKEKKEWKEKGEKKEWKKENQWKDKTDNEGKGERKHWEGGKNQGKERSGKDERKQWDEHEWSKNGKHDKEWKRKDEEEWKRGRQEEKNHNGDWKKEKSNPEKSSKFNHVHKEEHLYGDGKPPHTHCKPSLDLPEYWQQQKARLQHNPKPPQQCSSLETCAQAENLLPVPLPEFEAILQTYLAKAEEAGVDESKTEELRKLTAEFFKDGVFAHDQMSFQDFVEDVGDILEDMVEGDEEEEDSAIEDEMEEFEREVMEKFSVPGVGEKEERIKGIERGRG